MQNRTGAVDTGAVREGSESADAGRPEIELPKVYFPEKS